MDIATIVEETMKTPAVEMVVAEQYGNLTQRHGETPAADDPVFMHLRSFARSVIEKILTGNVPAPDTSDPDWKEKFGEAIAQALDAAGIVRFTNESMAALFATRANLPGMCYAGKMFLKICMFASHEAWVVAHKIDRKLLVMTEEDKKRVREMYPDMFHGMGGDYATVEVHAEADIEHGVQFRHRLHQLNEKAMQEMAYVATRSDSPDASLILCIDVDDPVWSRVVEALAPEQDWQPIRDRGERPVCLATISVSEWIDFLSAAFPDLPSMLATKAPIGAVRVLVMAKGVGLYYVLPKRKPRSN